MESRLIGKVVSRRFRVEEVIGRGGMSIVYRAFDLRTRQTVAFKVLREEYENDDEYRERFNREAEVCRRLNHPNIVNLIDSGAVGGVRYIALEYVDGQTLKDVIRSRGRLTQDEAVHYALQILAALAHAHSRRVIHRDVKPQNLMLTRSGQLKVGDFGIAGIADTKTLTSDGSVIGSVHYFSPEQAKGMRATEASDLYSVGVILYEMLTGHVPFDGESAVSVAMMHLMKEPTPVEQEAEVSPAVAKILQKALRKQPQERYQSAEQMTRDLRRALRHPDGRFMDAENRRQHTQRLHAQQGSPWGRRLLIGAIVLLIALAGLAGFALYRSVFVVASVPDVVGLDQDSARRLIEGEGLTARLLAENSEEYAEGLVFAQEPAAQASARKGGEVTLRVSLGSGLVSVPLVTGLSLEEAQQTLAQSGFVPGQAVGAVSEAMRGLVIGQEPEFGAKALPGAQVELTVSLGVVVVPQLVGLREEEAVQRAEQVGLVVGELRTETVRQPSQDGVIQMQSPGEFERVAPGDAVVLTVGRYPLRDKTATVSFTLDVPERGCQVRVTLVDEGQENEMYAAQHQTPGEQEIEVTLRSETSGPKKWRLYVDGNLKEEHEITML